MKEWNGFFLQKKREKKMDEKGVFKREKYKYLYKQKGGSGDVIFILYNKRQKLGNWKKLDKLSLPFIYKETKVIIISPIVVYDSSHSIYMIFG